MCAYVFSANIGKQLAYEVDITKNQLPFSAHCLALKQTQADAHMQILPSQNDFNNANGALKYIWSIYTYIFTRDLVKSQVRSLQCKGGFLCSIILIMI